jgi:hypothetical protein
MNTNPASTDYGTVDHRTTNCGTTGLTTTGLTATGLLGEYALRREGGFWELAFEGRQSTFKHELGALYVAYLLLEPPKEPLHGVALALNARTMLGQPASPDEVLQQQAMRLEDFASVRTLWRRQRELERVLEDRLQIEPVKAEARREWEEVTTHLRQSPWLSRRQAKRCARAVGAAMRHLHARLATALDAKGRADAVLRAFALHLYDHLLAPSGRGGAHTRVKAGSEFAGCFIYVPPSGVVWTPAANIQHPTSNIQHPTSNIQHPTSNECNV